MKVRLTDNAVRIRVTLDEIHALSEGNAVSTNLVLSEANHLVWVLVPSDDASDIDISSVGSSVTVTFPSSWTDGWEHEDRVGFDGRVGAGKGQAVEVLIQKDFPCRHPKSTPDP